METKDRAENLPSISIIIVALNCVDNIRECIANIKSQDYPAEIEILEIDGGSTDGTREASASLGARVVNAGHRDNCEPRRAVGLVEAKNEIICYIESDIFLPTDQWLRQMVEPLLLDEEIVAVQSLRYEYRKTDRLLNRYFALMGIHDPIAYYLRKRDKLTWFDKKWTLFGKPEDMGAYYKVKFELAKLPPLGCNGFMARRQELLDLTLPDPARLPYYTHSDSVFDLVAQGRDTLAFVKNTVVHVPCNDSVWRYLKRRMFYTKTLHFGQLERKYKVYDSRKLSDNLRLVKYSIYSLTIVKPLFDSLRGFISKPDAAWFMHPLMCFMMFVSYSFVTIKQLATSLFVGRAK